MIEMNEIILQTKRLCKTFKKQEAVKDVSISVQRNSIYGLLGPNGAGKSTLLKMIIGMLRPTSGEVLLVASINTLVGGTTPILQATGSMISAATLSPFLAK